MKPLNYLTIIGCCLIHFVNFMKVIGSIYCIGIMIPYLASYISYESGHVTMLEISPIFYVGGISWSLSFQITAVIQRKYLSKM